MNDISKYIEISGVDAAEIALELCSKTAGLRFVAKGGSMSPFIRDNDTITIFPYNIRRPETGDIVACINPLNGNLIVHRIIIKKNDLFLIKGDNCFKSDGFFHRENIIGYVKNLSFLGIKISNVEKKSAILITIMVLLNQVIAILSRYGFLKPIINILRKIKLIFTHIFRNEQWKQQALKKYH
ncbi:MAG: S26 family signal peptidase [Thermodesulfobacteriota bacterium]|nr:S26 family signal peptidase [Thermodesulfobacteriota bacterium]